MNKVLKKSLSVFLAVVMMVSAVPLGGFAGIELPTTSELFNFKASAATTFERYDFAEIQECVDNYQNKADDFDLGIYLGDYFTTAPAYGYIGTGMELTPVSPRYVEDLNNNLLFKAAYGAWETASFVANPVEGAINILTRETFYETALFRILDSTYSSNNLIDWLNRGAIKNSTKICSILAKSAELDYKYEISNRIPISDLSEADKEYIVKTCEGIIKNDTFQYAASLVGNVSKILSTSKNIEQYAERLGTYLQLSKIAEETVEFLKLVKENTDDSKLKKAIDTVIAVTNDSCYDFLNIIAEDATLAIGKAAIRKLLGSKWKEFLVSTLTSGVLSTGAVLIDGALLAINIGKTVSNIAFNTDKKLEHFELTKAFVDTENAIKDTVKQQLSSYDGSSEKGLFLASGIDLLYSTYDMDSELCLDLVNIMDKDWIQLSTKEEREEAKENINYVRNYYLNQYNNIVPESGSCGANLFWVLDKVSGELIVYGYGEMYDYEQDNLPWNDVKNQINSIHISSFCWKLGENAFNSLTELNSPNSNVFQDYDGDGLLDNVDPYPLDPLNNQNDTGFEIEFKDSEITILNYTGAEKELVIPNQICGYNVASIKGINNSNVESIYIGDNIADISSGVFNSLNNLKEITVSENNTNYSSVNGMLYNSDCTELIRCPVAYEVDKVSLPNTVNSLAQYSFSNCNISNVVINDSLSVIGSSAFKSCKNLKNIDLKNVKNINGSAFSSSGLTEITIPETVESIGLQAFTGCTALTTLNYNAVNSTITTILNICPFPASIKNLLIGEKVERIPDYLLKNCSISEIIIPPSVIEIGDRAFYNCSGLTIKAYSNSCAKSYAETNGYNFIAITCGNCICDDWTVITDSTCATFGEKKGICSVCGATVTSEVSLKEHTYGDWKITIAATCAQTGSQEKVCSACGDKVTEIINVLGHKYSTDWTTDKEATCKEEGTAPHQSLPIRQQKR